MWATVYGVFSNWVFGTLRTSHVGPEILASTGGAFTVSVKACSPKLWGGSVIPISASAGAVLTSFRPPATDGSVTSETLWKSRRSTSRSSVRSTSTRKFEAMTSASGSMGTIGPRTCSTAFCSHGGATEISCPTNAFRTFPMLAIAPAPPA